MTASVCVPVCRRAGYVMHLEEEADHSLTFWHCTVTAPWSRTLRASLLRDLGALSEMHGGPLYCISHAPHAGDPIKFHKFMSLCGFSPLCMAPSAIDGVPRQVFIRR